MKIVVSGIRSTGNLHLGNFFGAIQNFIKLQHEQKCYFFIADYHSLTTHPKPADFHSNVKQVLTEYLAAGINPEAATLYVQSDVPEVTELYLLLNMNAYKGELERCTSFKEKARKHPDNINAGLLTYPVLMAADILIHKAHYVPVGKDQEQHLEMARDYAKRFNQLYETECFPEPTAYNFGSKLIKIPGLDGSGKMGKSESNGIYLVEDPKLIEKKIMRAVTDSGPTQANQAKPEAIENLFTILRIVSSMETIEYFEDQYNTCQIRYGDLKKQLAKDIIELTNPIRERFKEISSDNHYLQKVVKMGAEKAQESARKTIKEVREIIGIKPF